MKRAIKLFLDDVRAMSPKEHFWFWIFPSLVLAVLMLFYFSGISPLAGFVAPEANREWGALENLQVIVLLGVAGLAVYTAIRKRVALEKWGFALLAPVALFFCLEEMDYGRHITAYFSGEETTTFFRETFGSNNIHNRGNNNTYFRRTPYLIILFLFGLAPLLRPENFHPAISYFIPRPRMLIIVLLFGLAYWTPRLLVRWANFDVGALGSNNIGEFAELMVYVSFLIYTAHLSFEKEWRVPA